MEILTPDFIFDRKDFDRRIRIQLYEGMEEEIDDFLVRTLPLIRPKALFREVVIHRNRKDRGFCFQAEDQCFDDPVTEEHLKDLDRIFPYIATCGNELEDLAASSGDMLEVFWMDALKQMSMDRAFSSLMAHIKTVYSLDKIYSLNPGSDTCREGWDLENQKILFALLPGAEENIGVSLTASLLMKPNKTVSGIFFRSDRDYVGCRDCGNINCPNRRVIHDGAILT